MTSKRPTAGRLPTLDTPAAYGRRHSAAAALALLALTPVSVAAATLATAFQRGARREPAHVGTVVLNGGKMSKALFLARTFHGAGYRVVLAETADYRLSGHQLSRHVDVFRALPSLADGAGAYEQALTALIREQDAVAFVPVSSPASAVADARVGEAVRDRCRVIHASSALTATLDDKFAFCSLARSLGLPAPTVARITDASQLPALVADADRPMVLKPLAYEPMARLAPVRFPAPDALARARALPITPNAPWVLQDWLAGQEYCTHSVVVDGVVRVFGCSRSSAFQVNYEHVEHPAIRDWVERFCAATGLTGQVAFDFIETDDGRVCPIECNPRTHSAVTMFHDTPGLADAYLQNAADWTGGCLTPRAGAKPTYWLAHELTRLTQARSATEVREVMQRIGRGRDAVFEAGDPWPFVGLHHVQMPALLLRTFAQRSAWARVDFNIGKVVQQAGD